MKGRHFTKRERKLTTPPPCTPDLNSVDPSDKGSNDGAPVVAYTTIGTETSQKASKVLIRSSNKRTVNRESTETRSLLERKSERRREPGIILFPDSSEPTVATTSTAGASSSREWKDPRTNRPQEGRTVMDVPPNNRPLNASWKDLCIPVGKSDDVPDDGGLAPPSFSSFGTLRRMSEASSKAANHSIVALAPSSLSCCFPFQKTGHEAAEKQGRPGMEEKIGTSSSLPQSTMVHSQASTGRLCNTNDDNDDDDRKLPVDSEEELQRNEEQLLQRGDGLTGAALRSFLEGAFLDGLGSVDSLLSNWKL